MSDYIDNQQVAIDLHSRAYVALGELVRHLKETTGSHDSICASDDQYDDPELWWARPALAEAQELLSKLDDIYVTLENG